MPLQNELEPDFGRAKAEIKKLRAEVARLRAALRQISESKHYDCAVALAREVIGEEAILVSREQTDDTIYKE